MKKNRVSRRRWLFVSHVAMLSLIVTSVSVQLFEDHSTQGVAQQGIHVASAEATSQWARKYEVGCQTCHTAFPRLNYMGEQFKRNGYQMPGSADGDETKKAVGENTFIDKLGHLFGLRINITPVAVNNKGLTQNGSQKLQLNFGNANWLQLFTAGSIFKNTSIFIETEIGSQTGGNGTIAHNNWMTLGFHNLGTSLLNVRVGKLSPMENFGQPGRLRMIPSVRVQGIQRVNSSGGVTAASIAAGASAGVAEDSVPLSNAQAAIEAYGYKGPFLYSVGVSNGAGNTGAGFGDLNRNKNFFGTLRGDLTSGALEGSNISAWGTYGVDTATTSTAQVKNKFWRMAGAANVRWGAWDFIGSYAFAKDPNWNLGAAAVSQKTHMLNAQLGYLISPRWFAALQYDWVDGTDRSDDYHKVTPAITFMPRENMRIDLIARYDLEGATTATKQHEAMINVRSMF